MEGVPEARSPADAARGMATVAILKLNFDAGRDHISMFEPFVLDTTARCIPPDGSSLGIDAVRDELVARHQLAVPVPTLKTLLARLAKRGYLRLSDGRYVRTDKPVKLDDLTARREQVEDRQRRLAASLQAYAGRRDWPIATVEDALAAILGFVEQYHVSLALGEVSQAAPRVPTSDDELEPIDRQTLVVAEFIQNAIYLDGEDAEILQEFLEGFILHNALLLKDISLAGRRYDNLHVVFDNRLLFAALGVRGEAEEIATKDLLSLLRQTGAVTDVFETTIAEMRRILRVYEEKIGTSAGRLELRPTDMTRYFITKRYTPSDIRTLAALLERNLKALGFNLRELPRHREDLTLDERELGKRLSNQLGENEPRVVHDVDCVAGVITMRGGRRAVSLETARAVFVTDSAMTIRNVLQWYRDEGKTDAPPIIHYLALSNHAWLKRPADSSRLKIHELIALCAAALRPSREAWEAFLKYLKRLQESNELSSDEVTAIIASELTDQVLVDDEIDTDTPADTLSAAVERVIATYREQDVQATEGAAAEVLQLKTSIEGRARLIASILCWTAAAAIAAVVVAGAAITVNDLRSGAAVTGIGFVLAALFAVAGLVSLLFGFHLRGWRRDVEERLARTLRDWLSGNVSSVVTSDASPTGVPDPDAPPEGTSSLTGPQT